MVCVSNELLSYTGLTVIETFDWVWKHYTRAAHWVSLSIHQWSDAGCECVRAHAFAHLPEFGVLERAFVSPQAHRCSHSVDDELQLWSLLSLGSFWCLSSDSSVIWCTLTRGHFCKTTSNGKVPVYKHDCVGGREEARGRGWKREEGVGDWGREDCAFACLRWLVSGPRHLSLVPVNCSRWLIIFLVCLLS